MDKFPMAPHIAFDIKNYENESMMMIEVGMIMSTLLRNGYQCLFRYEDCGIYVLEFLEEDRSWGANRFAVLTAEEEEELYFNRTHQDESPSIDDLVDDLDTPTASEN